MTFPNSRFCSARTACGMASWVKRLRSSTSPLPHRVQQSVTDPARTSRRSQNPMGILGRLSSVSSDFFAGPCATKSPELPRNRAGAGPVHAEHQEG